MTHYICGVAIVWGDPLKATHSSNAMSRSGSDLTFLPSGCKESAAINPCSGYFGQLSEVSPILRKSK